MIKYITVVVTFIGEGEKKTFSFNLDHSTATIAEFITELKLLAAKFGDIIITSD
jgi:hypothetical protein